MIRAPTAEGAAVAGEATKQDADELHYPVAGGGGDAAPRASDPVTSSCASRPARRPSAAAQPAWTRVGRAVTPAHTRAVDVSSRLPGLVLLVLVVGAAALLLAGLGVAVGTGLLVGLALGLVAILGTAWRQPGHGAAFLTTGPTSAPDHDVVLRFHRDWTAVSAVDASPLERVVALGGTSEARGVRVELIAVELRQDGGIAMLAARARPPAWIGHFVEVSVSDDAGTPYAAAGQGSGSSSPGVGRIELRFAPAPPPGARRLTLRVGAFIEPFPGPARRLPGPWSFEVGLRADGG